MSTETIEEQLSKYLADAHSIEEQALAQMRTAPKLAGDPQISAAFAQHLLETEEHERLVRECLEAHDAGRAIVKDLAGSITGKGMTLFARLQPDTPGKLVVHAFSYEHMELAAYELIADVAARAGDERTVAVARRIAGQEEQMGQRLASLFERAATASLRELAPDDLGEQVNRYLADAHAIEAQALKLLDTGSELAGSAELASAYEEHRSETEEHQRLIEERLEQRGASRSRLKDAALSLGALNLGGFFKAQPDTPAKLAAFAYAFEHLEIGAYELLMRVAQRAGDGETARVTEFIVGQERAAAARVRSLFDRALDATLHERSMSAR